MLRDWSGVCTWVWNSALEQRQWFYKNYVVRECDDDWWLVYQPRHCYRRHPDGWPPARRRDGATLSSGRSGPPVWAKGLPRGGKVLAPSGHVVGGQLRQLQEARATIPEVAAVPAQVVNSVLYQLDQAYQDAFRRAQEQGRLGLPRYRTFRRVRINLPSYGQTHYLADSGEEVHYLFLTTARGQPKTGAIRVRSHLPLGIRDLGEMQVWEEHGQWHGSIVLRDPAPRPPGAAEGAIGINRGVVHFATLSNGERLEGFTGEPELEKWRLHRERGASRRFRLNNQNNVNRDGRRLPGRRLVRSNSERKVRNKVGKLSAALARMRREELHLIANDLLDGYHTICIEDLDIQQMTRSAHGTIDDPGRNVARRTRLNRRILEKAWGEFARILEYKSEERGNRVVRVDPKYISRQCPECGLILDRNPGEHTRVFRCPGCGHIQDVDVVAARNVLTRGLAAASVPVPGRSQRALAPPAHRGKR